MVTFLQELVRCESVTGNERPVQRLIQNKLESLDLEVDVWEADPDTLREHPGYFVTTSFEEYGYENRPNVAAVVEGTGVGRSLAFSGHVDTVSAVEAEWTRDPWGADIESGKLYGRGAADMKGGIAAFVHAYEMVREEIDLAGDLILLTTIEEEAGGVGGLLSALERGYRPDAAVVPEPWSIPNVGIASAGVLYFRVRVPGKSAHGARGYNGVNAIDKAYLIRSALDELDANRKGRIDYEPAVRRNPEAAGNVTNLNVGVFSAGTWPSTVPGEAVLECRIGWPPGESREEVREQVVSTITSASASDEWLTENPPEIEWFGWSAEPHEVETDDPFVTQLRRNAERVTGRTGAFIGGMAGLDERFYNNYYDIPAATMGPSGANIHGADEYVEIDSLVETATVMAGIAIDWCGLADEA